MRITAILNISTHRTGVSDHRERTDQDPRIYNPDTTSVGHAEDAEEWKPFDGAVSATQ